MSSSSVVSGVRCFRWEPAAAEHQTDRRNFGDEIGPELVRAIVAREGVRDDRDEVVGRRLLSVGSVMQFAQRGDVVWGSGINGKVWRLDAPSTLDVRAVRGPLTRTVLLARGIPVPAVYGDPALLIPRLFPDWAAAERGDRHIVVPNLNELDRFSGPEVVSPLGDPEEIIRTITGAGFVAATSLHALIVADAFGIPSRPIVSSAESSFKYVDYYAGTGRPDVEFAGSLEEALAMGPVAPPQIDLDALEAAFPWDLWGVARPPREASSDGPLSYLGLRGRAAAARDEFVRSLGSMPSGDTARAVVRLDQFLSSGHPTKGITREDAAVLGVDLPHMRTRSTRPDLVLSVVMPTHNVAPWVRETLDSVLAQDVDGMEVIIVDDHSIDDTPGIVAEYAARDDRITVVDAVSRGGGTARNLGLDHARGKYVVFCDGDDIIPDGAYRALVDSLERSGSDVAIGDYLKFRPVDTWRPTDSMAAFRRPATRTSVAAEPTLLYSRPCWNMAFSRGWWEARGIRFPDAPRSNDIVPMVKAYLFARRIDIIPDVVYLYRERPGASSMTAAADSTTSMLSYLAQERECAQLVSAAHSRAIDDVYSALVYDRDGYVHVARYVARWEAPRAGDAAVAAALRSLLSATPGPSRRVSPLKRLTMELAAREEMRAARVVAAVVSGDGGSSPADWVHALERVSEQGLVHLWDEAALRAPVTDALVGPVGEEDISLWRALVETIRRQFGERGLMLVPEARLGEADADRAVRARDRVSGVVTAVSGGTRELVLEGRAAAGEETVLPVLYDGEFAGNPPIRPARVAWHREGDAWGWRAVFPLSSIPLHRPLAPALQLGDGGVCVAVQVDAEMPEYDVRDSFLYDRHGRAAMIRRRRHWGPRAARRGLIVARERVRRLGRP